MTPIYAGVDIGGTKILLGLGTETGRLLATERFDTQSLSDPDSAMDAIADGIRRLASTPNVSWADVVGVGVGSPGPLKDGKMLRSPNMRGWAQVDWVKGLRQRLDRPTVLENDASAAALGEWMFGAGREAATLLYVTVSTGVGAGVVEAGRLTVGGGKNAGEIGHLVLHPDGPWCVNGHGGCVEMYGSGTALARMAHERQAESPVLRKAGTVDAAAVIAGWQAEDPVCTDIVSLAAYHLGWGLGSAINLFNPDKIVLGGGVMEGGGLPFLHTVKQAARRFAIGELFDIVAWELAGLDKDSGVLGAMALAVVAHRDGRF